MYGNSPRTTLELRKLDKGEISSGEVEEFVEHLKNIHEELRQHITKMNAQYKPKANVKRRYKEFQVGHEVMVHLRKEHFLIGTYNKLKMKNFGPCKIVKRHDSGNAYAVELLVELNILDFIEFYEGGDVDEVIDI